MNVMKDYDACLFDLYGTLVDIHTDESRPAPWRVLADFAGSADAFRSLPALRAEYSRLCREREEKLRERFSQPEIDLIPVFSELFSRRLPRPGEEELRALAWRFRCASTSHLRLYAGAKELLAALRAAGKTVILLSNAQSAFTMPELRLLGIHGDFHRIYLSSDHGCRKPDPAFFSLPLRELALRPERCLMIGNDPDCDIRGAAGVGMDSYYIHTALSPAWDPTAPATYRQRGQDLRLLKKRLTGTESERSDIHDHD